MAKNMTLDEVIEYTLDNKQASGQTLRAKYLADGFPKLGEFAAALPQSDEYTRFFDEENAVAARAKLKEHLEKSVVQRNPKQFGITGTVLATAGVFAVSAAIMLGLELGLGIGVWSVLTATMPFLAVLGAGVPALLAFAAVLAAVVLVGYAISVGITHLATRQHVPDVERWTPPADDNSEAAARELPKEAPHHARPLGSKKEEPKEEQNHQQTASSTSSNA